jgi:hypothetical protein
MSALFSGSITNTITRIFLGVFVIRKVVDVLAKYHVPGLFQILNHQVELSPHNKTLSVLSLSGLIVEVRC